MTLVFLYDFSCPRPTLMPPQKLLLTLLHNSILRVQQQKRVHPFRGSPHLDMLELGDVTIGCPEWISQP